MMRGENERLRRRIAELESLLGRNDTGRKLASIFDDMFEGIQILDPDLAYVYVNRTAARHGRRSPDELVGRRMSELYPGIDETVLYSSLRSVLLDRSPRQMINEFTYPDGSRAWFDLRISPVPMGVMVLSIDITSRMAGEEDARRSREDLEATLSCMTDAVLTTDLDGRLARMNLAAERLTGWRESEAIGRPLAEVVKLVDPMTSAEIDDVLAHARHGIAAGGLHASTLLVRQDGGRVPVTDSAAPLLDSSGVLRGSVLVLRDVTEERRLNDMLQQSQRLEALGRLAAGVAHDFNNLLTIILGCAESLLLQLPEDGEAHRRAQRIHEAVARATSLTKQLLAVGRRQVLDPVTLDLNDVVQNEERLLHRAIGEDVELATRLDPRLWAIRADPALLGQVVMNLAVNARDAMPDGGRLTIQTSNVELDDEYERTHVEIPAGRYVMMAVSDTGCGMDAATRARIFEPFFTTKEPGKGTGLGLATVFGIVRQNRGHIWVYSEPGHGTTFKIYFPAVAGEEPGIRTVPRTGAARGSETVLLVEDDHAVREITAESLQLFGYTVIEAANGEEALAASRSHHGGIDLLLTDVILPGMGGAAIASAIAHERPGIRVLFLSGYTEEDVVRHGIDGTAVAFLQKPFTAGALARKVREVLGGC